MNARCSKGQLTVNEGVENVLSVLLHQVVDVPEDTTATSSASVPLVACLVPAYHMFAAQRLKGKIVGIVRSALYQASSSE